MGFHRDNCKVLYALNNIMVISWCLGTGGQGKYGGKREGRRKKKGKKEKEREEPFGFAQGKISPAAKFWCGREDSNLHALRR
jgi:hypothetical protein